MTNQNNTAHDLSTSSGGRAYIAEYFATQLRRHDFARYINSTLAADFACVLAQHLSKLRAEGVHAGEPVADTAERQCPRCTGNGTILRLSGNGPDAYDVQEECPHCEGAGVVASVPVAGEAVAIPLRPLTEDERAAVEFYTLNPTAAVRDLDTRLSGHAAPQASAEPLARYCPGCGSVGPVGDEYRDCCPDGNQARMIPARLAEKCRDTFRLAIQTLLADAAANDSATPQATEAVRILFPAHLRKMWSGGEVQTWLDEHQGITPPNASAKGSLERYRKWQAEKTQADKDGCANG
jgi:hypothetical protein